MRHKDLSGSAGVLSSPFSCAGALLFRRPSAWFAGLLMAALLFLPLSALWADCLAGHAGGMEEILGQARIIIGEAENNGPNLERAISILEGHCGQYPTEIRFPLYLAQAYYMIGSEGDKIKEAFPYFEKTEEYAQKVMKIDPERPEGHYWNGLFLLRKAQFVNSISAYFLVRKGIKELETVRKSMPEYDHAGASRVLCLLRFLAPGWTPFGSLSQSIELGEEAVRLAPDFPLNRLYLADAYKKRGDKQAAIRQYHALLDLGSNMAGRRGEGFRSRAESSLRSLGISLGT